MSAPSEPMEPTWRALAHWLGMLNQRRSRPLRSMLWSFTVIACTARLDLAVGTACAIAIALPSIAVGAVALWPWSTGSDSRTARAITVALAVIATAAVVWEAP